MSNLSHRYTLAEIKNGTGFVEGVEFTVAADYNGWTNYPTWAVNLHLANDQGTYEYLTGLIAELLADEPDHPRYSVAHAIEEFVTEAGEFAGDLHGLTADLFGYAIGCINWYEIADAWMVDE